MILYFIAVLTKVSIFRKFKVWYYLIRVFAGNKDLLGRILVHQEPTTVYVSASQTGGRDYITGCHEINFSF